MIEIPSSSDILLVYGEFMNFTPEELFDYWVKPDLIIQWWPPVVEINAEVGGAYRFTWPELQTFLQGTYSHVDRGRRWRFSWTWNHEPGVYEPLWVDIHFMPIDHGTRMSIMHGPFSNSESDQQARKGVIEGWIHFGMRLAGLRPGEDL